MKHHIITLIIVLGFVYYCCRDSKSSNCSVPDYDGVLFPINENYSSTDTIYPIRITDSVQINYIVEELRNKLVPQKDYNIYNLEEGEFYLLGKFLVVNCMLVGPSGWASNFSQFFIIDVKNHRNVHIMSLSNNINNFFYLIIWQLIALNIQTSFSTMQNSLIIFSKRKTLHLN